MKKPVILLIVILSAITGFFLGLRFLSPGGQEKDLNLPALEQPTPTPSPNPTPEPGNPVTFISTTLGINAPIESVGLDAENKMDVPKNAMNVAWYNLGSKPGEFGNAVLAGHLDTAAGGPAVFYNITSLKPGDEVSVVDDKQKTYTYSVTRTVTYRFDQVPLQEVFGETDGTYLNLITCEGAFDTVNQNYSHRTVVYTELVE